MRSFAHREPPDVNRAADRDGVLCSAVSTRDVATAASLRTPATPAGSHPLVLAHSSCGLQVSGKTSPDDAKE